MLPPLATLSDDALLNLESATHLEDHEWRAVLAEISRRKRTAAAPAPRAVPNGRAGVTITGVDIPFFDLVGLLVKLTLAALPAALIIGVVTLLFGVFAGAFFNLGSRLH